MFSTRWRKVLRDLWGNKARTILVVLSIAVGVFAVGMIAGTSDAFGSGLNGSWAGAKPPDATLYTYGIDEDMLWTVRSWPNVKGADARRGFQVRFKTDPNAETWRNLQLYSYPDFEDIRVQAITPVRGAWPPPDKAVLIERASLEWMGVEQGQSLWVEAPNGRTRELVIAGVTHDVSQQAASWNGRGTGYINLQTLAWMGLSRDFDELNLQFEGQGLTKDEINVLAGQVRDRVERSGRTVGYTWVPNPGEHPANEVIQPIMILLGVLGLLALILSGFLVINTLQALLAQQVRQIGIMKAIGGRNGQIMGVYYSMVLVFCVLALAIGIPLGALGAQAQASFMAGILNFDIGQFRVPPGVMVLEMAVGLLVPLLAALWPIVRGVRVPAREAMSDYGLGKGVFGTGLLDRALERVRGLSRPMMLSLRNTFRRKGRLALTLATLTLAGAIFVGVFSVQASLFSTLEDMFTYVDYDAYVGFRRGYRADLLEQEALKVPGVTAAEAWRFGSARRVRDDDTESESVMVYAPPPSSKLVRPKLVEGRWLLPEDEAAVVVNTMFVKDEPDVHAGSLITLTIGDQEELWTVVGVIKGTPPMKMFYTNLDSLARVQGGLGRAGVVFTQTASHDGASQAAAAKALEAHFEDSGFQVSNTQTSSAEKAQIGSTFNVLVMFLLIMAILLAVVGAIGLMGTMSLNVLERTREIGVMRAIGAGDGAILKIVIVEGLVIGALSWVIGAALAAPLGSGLSKMVGDTIMRASLNNVYSVQGAGIWLVAVMILAALASAWPARNASRVTVRDVLAYE